MDGAESRWREALRIRRNVLGEQHAQVAESLFDLVRLLCFVKRDYAAAEPLAQELLVIRRKTLPEDDPGIANALVDYAQISIELGKHQQALDALHECLACYRRKPPADDWRAANAESMFGGCLAALGRYEEAEPYLRDSYPRIEAKRGAQDRFTMRAKERLDKLYEAWGQRDAAPEPSTAPTSRRSVDGTP